MSIFEKEEEKEDSSFLKVNIFEKKEKLFLMIGGWSYDLSPSPFTQINLSPVVKGVDVFIKEGMKIKGIKEKCTLEVSEKDIEFKCDARVDFNSSFFDGWIYDLQGEYLMTGSKYQVWICPYMKFFFQKPPKTLYLRIC
jgi:hypothetical protein